MKEILLKLKNGYIKDIVSDYEYYPGSCPTCDYGAQYISKLNIYLSSKTINVEVSNFSEYELTDGYLIKLFICNLEEIKKLTEEEFCTWFKEKLNEEKLKLEYIVVNKGDF